MSREYIYGPVTEAEKAKAELVEASEMVSTRERHAFMAGAEFLRDSIRRSRRGNWSYAGMSQVIKAADEYEEGKR